MRSNLDAAWWFNSLCPCVSSCCLYTLKKNGRTNNEISECKRTTKRGLQSLQQTFLTGANEDPCDPEMHFAASKCYDEEPVNNLGNSLGSVQLFWVLGLLSDRTYFLHVSAEISLLVRTIIAEQTRKFLDTRNGQKELPSRFEELFLLVLRLRIENQTFVFQLCRTTVYRHPMSSTWTIQSHFYESQLLHQWLMDLKVKSLQDQMIGLTLFMCLFVWCLCGDE